MYFSILTSPNLAFLIAYIIIWSQEQWIAEITYLYLGVFLILVITELVTLILIWFKYFKKNYLKKLNNQKSIIFNKNFNFDLLENFDFKITHSSKMHNKIGVWYNKSILKKLEKSNSKIESEKIIFKFIHNYCSIIWRGRSLNMSYFDMNRKIIISEKDFVEYFENYVFTLYKKFI